jgi:flagellar biosynthetic protein FliO
MTALCTPARRMDSLLLVAFILIAISIPVGAQEIRLHADAATSQPTSADEPYSYSKIILAMGVVVGLIFALKWGAAKMAPGTAPRSAKSMSVLSRMPLGPKQQLILVKVGRRAVLVGNSGAQMNALCEISDPDELAHLVGQSEAEKSPVPLGAFAQLFKKREREFEPRAKEIVETTPTDEEEQVAQLARRELLGLSQRIRGLSEEMNGA